MVVRHTQSRFVERAMYGLLKHYGQWTNVYRIESETVDRDTGARRSVISKRTIKATPLERVAALKEFTIDFKSEFTQYDFGFVIKTSDLKGFVLELEDYILFNGHKYEVKKIAETTGNYAKVVGCVETPNDIFNQIHDETIWHPFKISTETQQITLLLSGLSESELDSMTETDLLELLS